jgi:serine/threonine protein kinase
MGKVYLALDERLGRKVALKVLTSDFMTNRDSLRRFKQEARITSALSHPNICILYEVGENAEGLHFISMEYVEGVTLRDMMNNAPMAISQVLEIGAQIAAALAAAHGAGIIHRDIKPENVIVRPDGYVKVLDFGVAKLTEHRTDAALGQSIHTTDPNMVVGTPRYMSPEQVRSLKVDARTDIWSLGVILYEMTTGQPPFDGPTIGDLIVSVLKSEPPPLLRYSTEAPTQLQQIIQKALMKEPENRYQRVVELLADLKALKSEAEAEPETVSILGEKDSASVTPATASGRHTGARTAPQSARPTIEIGMEGRLSGIDLIVSRIKRHKRALLILLALLLAAIIASCYLYFAGGILAATYTMTVSPFVRGDAAHRPRALKGLAAKETDMIKVIKL